MSARSESVQKMASKLNLAIENIVKLGDKAAEEGLTVQGRHPLFRKRTILALEESVIQNLEGINKLEGELKEEITAAAEAREHATLRQSLQDNLIEQLEQKLHEPEDLTLIQTLRAQNATLTKERDEEKAQRQSMEQKMDKYKTEAEHYRATVDRLQIRLGEGVQQTVEASQSLQRSDSELRRTAEEANLSPDKSQTASTKRMSTRTSALGGRSLAEVVSQTPAPAIQIRRPNTVRLESETTTAFSLIKQPEIGVTDGKCTSDEWSLYYTQFHQFFKVKTPDEQVRQLDFAVASGDTGCLIARARNLTTGRKVGFNERNKCAHCKQSSRYLCVWLKALNPPEGSDGAPIKYEAYVRR